MRVKYQLATKLPNYHLYKLAVIGRYQMAIEFANLYLPRPFKIYPNWDFWFENNPSGNPG
jgi:hypothetical protein